MTFKWDKENILIISIINGEVCLVCVCYLDIMDSFGLILSRKEKDYPPAASGLNATESLHGVIQLVTLSPKPGL